jgi:methylthioribose-1-phosphate isomerase
MSDSVPVTSGNAGGMRRSVTWNAEEKCLELIDQSLLPTQLSVKKHTTVAEVVTSISTMLVRGAPAIGVSGAYALALCAQSSTATTTQALLTELRAAKTLLDASRPTAVNLTWATQRVCASAEKLCANVSAADDVTVAMVAAHVLDTAQKLADDDIRINRAIGTFGAAVVPQGANILHHCNTGHLGRFVRAAKQTRSCDAIFCVSSTCAQLTLSLLNYTIAAATVGYGTALGVIYIAHEQKKDIHVWVGETRPRLQGARLTAYELMRSGVPMHLVVDSM